MPAVFISYSRRDKAFVERLHAALTERAYDVWVDWEDIPPSAEWFAEIEAGIRGADGFVYVISPDSVVSEICGRELREALEQHKRVVPVVWREPDGAPVPEAAAALNWVFLRAGDAFDAGIEHLTGALETDLEHVRTHTRLGVAAARWQASERDRSQLLRGTDLAAAEAWLVSGAGKAPEATALQREYVLDSRRAAQRRQRIVLGAVSAALFVAVVLTVIALVQRATAIHERNVAQARLLDSEALGAYAGDPELSVILAARAARSLPDTQSAFALRDALLHSRVRYRIPLAAHSGGDALWSPDGSRLLLTSPGHWTRIYAMGATKPLASLRGPSSAGMSAWDARGDRVIIGGGHPAVYDAATGRLLRALPPGALQVALNADGTRAVTIDIHADGHVIDVASGRQRASFHAPDIREVLAFALSPDGRTVALAGIPTFSDTVQGRLALFDTTTGAMLRELRASSLVGSVAFSPDSARFVYTTLVGPNPGHHSLAAEQRDEQLPGTLVYPTRGTGGPLQTFPGSATDAVFGPGELAYAVSTGSIQSVDNTGGAAIHVVRGAENHTLVGATGDVRTLQFDPGGADLLAAGSDGIARIYDAGRDGTPIATFAGHGAAITSASVRADDTFVATSSDDGTARVWQGLAPAPAARLTGAWGSASAAGFSENGDRLLITGGAGGAGVGTILSAATLRPLVRFRAPPGQAFVGARWRGGPVPVTALSGPSGPMGITPVEAETYNPHSGAVEATMRPSAGPVFYGFDVSRDGLRGAGSQSGGTVSVFALATGRRLAILRGEPTPAGDVALSPDGATVAVAHYPPLPATVTALTTFGRVTVQIWDAASGRLKRTISGPVLAPQAGGTNEYAPLTLAFSPDGAELALGGADQSVNVYAVATGRPLTPPLSLAGGAEGDFADSVQFSPDGRYLVAGAAIGAYVWRLRDFSALPPFAAEPGPGPYVGGGRGYSAGITSDGQTLFMTGNNNDEAWSLADHRQLLHAYPVAIGGGGAMDLAGTRMLAANGGGLSLYACPLCGGLPRLLAAARTRITRSLTAAERRRFLSTG